MPSSFVAFHGAHDLVHSYGLSLVASVDAARLDAFYSTLASRRESGPAVGMDGEVLMLTVDVDKEGLMDWGVSLEQSQPGVVAKLKRAGIWQEYRRACAELDYPMLARGTGTGCNVYHFLAHRAGLRACAADRMERAALLGKNRLRESCSSAFDALVDLGESARERYLELTAAMIEKYHGGQVEAGRQLASVGVPGMRYAPLADLTVRRTADQQTMFAPGLVTVTHRSGQVVSPSEGTALLAHLCATVETCRCWQVERIVRSRIKEMQECVRTVAAVSVRAADQYLPASEPALLKLAQASLS